jgi:hypothetical protein
LNALAALLDPAILFFAFGLFAGAMKSNLSIPEPIVKFLSLYLLMALGLKGGFALAKAGLDLGMLVTLLLATVLALGLPVLAYMVLKRRLNAFDAAAVAATYGSVSAVTFIAATQFLDRTGVAYSGHMVVAMVLMESPALIMAVALANWVRRHDPFKPATNPALRAGHLLHEAFTDGAHLLLLGGIVIGMVTGEAGKAMMAPFSSDLFKGMLAFFLLDMGLTVSRQFGAVRRMGIFLLGFGIVMPLLGAGLALGMARLIGLPLGDAVLLATLAASASYIVVPAALRSAIPEANQALYGGLALGVTFPFNLLVGIGLYQAVAKTMY